MGGGMYTGSQFDEYRQAVESFGQHIGDRLIVAQPSMSHTWAEVKAIIEGECIKAPVDLVVIDYLTLLNAPGFRTHVEEKTFIIQQAKQLAMRANDGFGLCLVTPVQGSRSGYESASTNDGAWEVSGIYQYSEMDKSLDNCFYTYCTPELSGLNKMKIGSCKGRRTGVIPASFVQINNAAGMLVDPAKDVEIRPKADEPYFHYLEWV
jgi:hypothetical protein